MTIENKKALPLQGYQFAPVPDSTTIGVLILSTANDRYPVLVDRKILLLLSEALAKHAQELDALQ